MNVLAGKATISNDGATILKLLDVVHPAAKTLVDIARSQDAEVMFSKVILAVLQCTYSIYHLKSRTQHSNVYTCP